MVCGMSDGLCPFSWRWICRRSFFPTAVLGGGREAVERRCARPACCPARALSWSARLLTPTQAKLQRQSDREGKGWELLAQRIGMAEGHKIAPIARRPWAGGVPAFRVALRPYRAA